MLHLVSPLTTGLLPINNAPIVYNTGISIGKLKGVITAVEPYGHL